MYHARQRLKRRSGRRGSCITSKRREEVANPARVAYLMPVCVTRGTRAPARRFTLLDSNPRDYTTWHSDKLYQFYRYAER